MAKIQKNQLRSGDNIILKTFGKIHNFGLEFQVLSLGISMKSLSRSFNQVSVSQVVLLTMSLIRHFTYNDSFCRSLQNILFITTVSLQFEI